MTISATKDVNPYLEASTGEVPSRQVQAARDAIAATLPDGSVLGEVELMHPHARSYFAKFPVMRQGSRVGTAYYDLKRHQVVTADQLPGTAKKVDPQAARKAWENVLARTPGSLSAMTTTGYGSYEISGVPSYSQDSSSYPGSGCGPTTAASILEYWRTNGYSAIKGLPTYGSEGSLIDHMYADAGFPVGGTSLSNWVYTVNYHLQESQVTGIRASSTAAPNTTYTQFKTEIAANRPVGVRIGSNNLGPGYWSYHWVTGMAYNYLDVENWYGVGIYDGYYSFEYLDYLTYKPYLGWGYVK